jgi:acetyl esterase/lipase
MMIDKQSFTYKIVEKCEIKADVYTVLDDVKRPIIMWIHGGALITGHRENISPDQIGLYVKAGYTLISIDYRLAPETKLKAIIEDIQDAYKWLREESSHLFNFNQDRIAIIGHSAGGYLTLMTGFCVKPRPKALISFYGYGDITGDWYRKPDPFYCNQPLISKEEAYRSVGGPIISEALSQPNRGRFYLYCRQHGLWPKEVSGHDPNKEPKVFDSFCPIRNITKEYPPTMLLHGDKDTDVPYSQSLMMANELARVGVEHKMITIHNGEHGFDKDFRDPSVADAFRRVVKFLKEHLS